jgi:glycosyltransferase involved in cell wall biosynthesis
MLTSFIAPYRVPLFEGMASVCADFRVFVVKPEEPSRNWRVRLNGLQVFEQRTFSIPTSRKHPHGFREPESIRIPYDTLPKLIGFNPDVIVADELGMRTLQAAVYRKLRQRPGLVVWAKISEATERGRGAARRIMRRVLLREADAVVVNGASGERYVLGYGIKPGKVFRVPQTTEIRPFLKVATSRSPEQRQRMLYCGRLVELKGLVTLLKHLSAAAAQRPQRILELWIAGDGPLRSTLEHYPRPANLDLRFWGNVSYDCLPEIYAQAGILVFPSLADEWGLVVVEGMASGLTVLGSVYSQAVEDLVSDGLNGWTFRPDDEQQFRSALDRALDSSLSVLERMGGEARNAVRDLTPESTAHQMTVAAEYALAHRS